MANAESVMCEKGVQLLCDSVFIVKLYETFGGDSRYTVIWCRHLEAYGANDKCAKFFVASTLFAFD